MKLFPLSVTTKTLEPFYLNKEFNPQQFSPNNCPNNNQTCVTFTRIPIIELSTYYKVKNYYIFT